MTTLSNNAVELRALNSSEAIDFYRLYAGLYTNDPPFAQDETALQFTERIMASCEYLWTIRLTRDTEKIIGDCALHDWIKETGEIEIGGSLMSQYQGQGIMRSAFELIIAAATKEMNIKTFIGITDRNNSKAIKLVQHLGFKVSETKREHVVLRLVTSS